MAINNKDEVADKLASPEAQQEVKAVSYEVANKMVENASLKQANDLAHAYTNEAIVGVSKENIKANISLSEQQLEATTQLQNALDEQTDYYALPGIVRLVGQVVNGKWSDEYHRANVANAANKVMTIEKQKQINNSLAAAKAQDLVGYNVVADPMVDKARAIMASVTTQRNNAKQLAQRDRELAIREQEAKNKSSEDSLKQLKQQRELAEYQINSLTNEAKAKEYIANRPTIERMSNGQFKSPDIDYGFRLIEASANQPVAYKDALIKQGTELINKSLDEQLNALPSEEDKVMFKTRLANRGSLKQTDANLASNYYYANVSQRSTTPSIEGRLLAESKPIVGDVVKTYYDNLTATEKDNFGSAIGKQGELSATELLMAFTEINKSSKANIKSLIPYNDLLAKSMNEPRTVSLPDGSTETQPSLYNQYKNELALDYGKFYLDEAANVYANIGRPNVASSLKAINGQPISNNDKLSKAIDVMISNGESYNGVSNFISGFADQSNLAIWADSYKSKSASYDNQAAAMIPILGFDNAIMDINQALRSDGQTKFYDSLLSKALDSINKRNQELNNLVKVQTNGR